VQRSVGQSSEQLTGRREVTKAATISRVTSHLTFAATLSPEIIEPGGRASITIDVTPRASMHVYAPGSIYRPFSISIEPNALLRVHDPVYPKPTRYVFKPLNEEILVYSAPFRIVLDINALEMVAGKVQRPSRAGQTTIKGKLEYQACDDTVCYLPTSVPLEWNMRVRR